MKIVTLNTWGGRAGKENLLGFFARFKDEVDVFCLQEMWSDSYKHLGTYKAGGVEMQDTLIMEHGVQEVSSLLCDHQAFFHPHHLDNYGLLMLVRNTLNARRSGEVYVHKEKGYVPQGDVGLHARNVQFSEVEYQGQLLSILNFHGLWNGQGKGDSDERLEQSRKIVQFLQSIHGPVVFCGDFNLLPETESIRMIENAGLRNLVKEYGVTSTRTSLYTKPEKFADYIFVSQDLQVEDFKVLPDEVSDHSPLYLALS